MDVTAKWVLLMVSLLAFPACRHESVPPPRPPEPALRVDEPRKPPACDSPGCQPVLTPAADSSPGAIDVCGNGKIGVRAFDRVCASCIPGRPCPCGWAPQMEECDGADLGGRSCESLGYLRGTLRCTADCRLDRSGCESTAPQANFLNVVNSAQALAGRDFALARNGGTLGVASSETGIVRFARFDAATLAPRGADASWRPPPNYPANSIGLERFQNAYYDPMWSPALAAMGDGFVLAVERAGYTGFTVLTFRASAQGPLGEPVASIPGQHPFFLIPGHGEALLGFQWHTVQVVRVNANGQLLGAPVSLGGPERALGDSAAAAFVGDGWMVVTGPRIPNDRDMKLRLTRVALDGSAGPPVQLDAAGSSFVLATEGNRVFLVYAAPVEGLFAVELSSSGAQRPALRIADGHSNVLAAELRNGELVVWTTAAGGIRRVVTRVATGNSSAQPVLAAPRLEAGAACLQDGAFYLLYKGEAGRPMLYMAR